MLRLRAWQARVNEWRAKFSASECGVNAIKIHFGAAVTEEAMGPGPLGSSVDIR